MRKSFIVLLLISAVLLMSCSSGGEIVDADIFIAAFEDAGLAISAVEYYTAETDPYELLGRPGQYAQKVSFTHTGEEEVEYCTIEIFKREKHANNREDYINEIVENLPSSEQHIIKNSNYIMRLALSVTPEEVKQLEAAFNSVIDTE